ncbi:hypothetical protein FLA_5495 [Filimonas lacunae]|nr:hypothetical protein FLA_5495 [Filimonas lacunae]
MGGFFRNRPFSHYIYVKKIDASIAAGKDYLRGPSLLWRGVFM